MPFISQSSIQEVIDRLDAVAVVSDYVRVEKRGGRFWACCPFHQEKTASFTVTPDLKTYYCFGCHKGGSIINFVMEMDKITFPEAIELLAKRFSVELAYENSGDRGFSAEDEARKKTREELFDLYHRISGTFHHFLLKKPESEAIKLYIIQRGISIEMIERFGLGYAPADRYWLYNFLSRKGYSGEFLAASGLFSSRNPQVSLFSDRLMFPIADRQGRTVAFGGRAMPASSPHGRPPEVGGREPPKYINSPELGIYKKGETLYAVDLALPEIRRTKTAYIAEGYMDVIALHQAGIRNALAPLGTAFTDEQAKLLKRWAEKVVFFFDSDGAGQAAVLKGIYTCRRNGLSCAVVSAEPALAQADPAAEQTPSATPDAATSASNTPAAKNIPPKNPVNIKDPADILLHLGAEALQKRAESVILDFDYLVARAGALFGTSGQGKAQAVAFLFPYIDLLDSEVARESCIEAAADTFGLLPAAVTDDYRRYISERKPADRRTAVREAEGGSQNRKEELSRSSEEKRQTPVRVNEELSLLIAVALDYISSKEGKFFPKFRAALEISEIEDQNAKEIFIALEECIRYGETGTDELLARISSPELRKIIIKRGASGEFSVNAEKLIADGINRIKVKRLERAQEDIIVKLRTLKKNIAEGERSAEEKELLSEKMRIDDELYQLKQGS